jgi:hypothetical protein
MGQKLFICMLYISSLTILISSSVSANDKKQQVDAIFSKLAKALPEESQIIAFPYVENLSGYGDALTSSVTDSERMFGGQVLHVKTKKSRNAYDAGIILPLAPEVSKGDVLYLTFFAYAIKFPEGKDSIKLEGVGVQQSAEPYASVFASSVSITEKLQSFTYAGIAQKDYKAGELQVTFQVATAKQEFAMGPVLIFNVGNEVDFKNLPYLSN